MSKYSKDHPFVVNFWGGGYERFVAKTGIKSPRFFMTEHGVNQLVKKINDFEKNTGTTIVTSVEHNDHVHYRTIACCEYATQSGDKWHYEDDFGWGYPPTSAEFYLKDGNGANEWNIVSKLRKVGCTEFDKQYELDELEFDCVVLTDVTFRFVGEDYVCNDTTNP